MHLAGKFNFILLFLITLIFIILISLQIVYAEPHIEGEIERRLNKSEFAAVAVTLIDVGEKEDNLKLQSEVIMNFSQEEFQLDWVSPNGRGFSGNITREGLEKLRNNENVLGVFVPTEGTTNLPNVTEVESLTKDYSLLILFKIILTLAVLFLTLYFLLQRKKYEQIKV